MAMKMQGFKLQGLHHKKLSNTEWPFMVYRCLKQIDELINILTENQDTVTVGEDISEESENVDVRFVDTGTFFLGVFVQYQVTCILLWDEKVIQCWYCPKKNWYFN